MSKILILMAIFAGVLLTGCDTQGAFVKQEEFEALKAEIVSAEQLVETLGPPTVAIPRSDGNILWLYRGIYKQADAGNYVPYLNFFIGTNSKTCTQLSVVVSKDDGSLSEWQYVSEEDTEFWAKTDDQCGDKEEAEESAS